MDRQRAHLFMEACHQVWPRSLLRSEEPCHSGSGTIALPREAASCVFYMESPYFLVLTRDSTLHLPPLQIAPLEILATNRRSLTYTGVSLGSPERTEQILCEIHPVVFHKRGVIASSFSSPGLRLKALLPFERELRGSCHQYMPTCHFRVA